MRKTQEKIYNKLKAKNYPNDCLEFIKNFPGTIKELELVYYYIKITERIDLKNLNLFVMFIEKYKNIYLNDYKNINYEIIYAFSKFDYETALIIFSLIENSADFKRKIVFYANYGINHNMSVEDSFNFYDFLFNDTPRTLKNEILYRVLSYNLEDLNCVDSINKKEIYKKNILNTNVKEIDEIIDYLFEEDNIIDKAFTISSNTEILKIYRKTINIIMKYKNLYYYNLTNALKKEIKEKLENTFPVNNVGNGPAFVENYDFYKNLVKEHINILEKAKSFELNINPVTSVFLKFSENSCEIKFVKYTSVRVEQINNEDLDFDKNVSISFTKGGNLIKSYVLFYDNFSLYVKRSDDNALKRISLKELKRDELNYGEYFSKFILIYLNIMQHLGSLVYIDVLKYFKEKSLICVPLLLDDLNGKHTWEEVYKEKYKKDLGIKWNKGNISLNYLFYITYNYIREVDKTKFLAILNEFNSKNKLEKFLKDLEFFNMDVNHYNSIYFTPSKAIKTIFLSIILFYKIKENDPNFYNYNDPNFYNYNLSELDIFRICNDYIFFTLKNRKKISISFKSFKKVLESHDEAYFEYECKMNKFKIKVIKNSKFNNLRKILPKEFEWIRTNKRLFLEGTKMHHCVYSYGPFISKDKCAIYSYLDKESNKRYTIEFIIENGKYKINQIQGIGNSGCPNDIRDYVKSFL